MSTPFLTPSALSTTPFQPTYTFYYRDRILFRGSMEAYFKRQAYAVKQAGPKVIIAGTAYDNLDAAYAALFPRTDGWRRRCTLAVFNARRSLSDQLPDVGTSASGTIPELLRVRVKGPHAEVQVVTGDGEYLHTVYVGGKVHGSYSSLKTVFDEFLGINRWVLGNAIAFDFDTLTASDDPSGSYADGEVIGSSSAVEFRQVSYSSEALSGSCRFVELPTPQPRPDPSDATRRDAKEKIIEALKRHLTGSDDYGAGLLEAYRLLDA